jgi:pimeloyl-ACP methyl ester carboxylesterase
MKRIGVAAGLCASLLLFAGGCSKSATSGNPPDVTATNPTSGNGNPAGGSTANRSDARALFVPLGGILPYPTDLYFSGSTDGTLNIPANPFFPNTSALNALDGFSTTAPFSVRFSTSLDATTLTAANVRVIQVTIDNTTKATTGVVRPLVLGTDFSLALATDAGANGTLLKIQPLKPLVPSTGATNNGYLVLLTNGLKDVSGATVTTDTDYQSIKDAQPSCAAITNATLNGICRLTGAHLQIASALGVAPATVIESFSFSTQNTRDTLNVVAAQVAAAARRPIRASFTGLNTKQVNAALFGHANVYAGTLQVPYYLNRAAPLTGSWKGNPSPLDVASTFLTRFNPVPVATETLTIPLLVTVPNASSTAGATKPVAGWPVVIFQHGITGDRTNMFGIADAFADAGFVVVAIDQPLHGITSTANPLYASPMNPLYGGTAPAGATSYERTFDLDALNNTTGANGPDGVVDASGASFINLSSLLTSRDNLRQAAADLLVLTRAVPGLDLDGDGTPDIDAARIHFVGHSLGGIVGTVYAGLPSAMRTATAAMPGGGIADLVRQSASFGPRIQAGLVAQGLTPGTTLYDQFFRDAQTAVDSGDPQNYIASAVALRPYHLIQVVGGGASLPDQVVPNSATQRLIVAAALPRVSTAGANAVSRGYVNFLVGDHGSILSPAASLAATVQMQTETVAFAATDGATILISNPAVVQP